MASATHGDAVTETEAAFRKVLNSHGHAFQFGLAAELAFRFRNSAEPWRVAAIEVPIEVQGYATRIDFVLECTRRPVWLVAECKRPDSALSNWCFVRAPALLEGQKAAVHAERLQFYGVGNHSVSSCGASVGTHDANYDLGLEVRSHTKGEGHTSGRGGIEDAMTQVARGINGLVSLAAANRNLTPYSSPRVICGVVFTTARIWTSDVALDNTDLKTGKVPFDGTTFKERTWIAYRYRLTPNLRHSFPCNEGAANMHDVVERDFVRTVFVVGPDGVSPFLKWAATGIQN